MFRLIIEGGETFNEETSTFEQTESTVLELEHSLLSLSKWESIYQKPFLSSGKKTSEEVFAYLQSMILTPNVDPEIVHTLSSENMTKIQEYVDSNQSATTFGEMPQKRGPGEVITSELIYFWMLSFSIPFECEVWHLNRLFSLIRICNVKNSKPTKMSRSEIAQRNRALNEKRKSELGTSG